MAEEPLPRCVECGGPIKPYGATRGSGWLHLNKADWQDAPHNARPQGGDDRPRQAADTPAAAAPIVQERQPQPVQAPEDLANDPSPWRWRVRQVGDWIAGAAILVLIFVLAALCSVIDPTYNMPR